jgi:hypothetical protein
MDSLQGCVSAALPLTAEFPAGDWRAGSLRGALCWLQTAFLFAAGVTNLNMDGRDYGVHSDQEVVGGS